MIGNLDTVLRAALLAALGSPPKVALHVLEGPLELVPLRDEAAGEPRPVDTSEQLPISPAAPAGPYRLSGAPLGAAQSVHLRADDGRSMLLRPQEVAWSREDRRRFELRLAPARDLAGVTQVEVRYSIPAVFTELQATQTLQVQLKAASALDLATAEVLCLAVIALERGRLAEQVQGSYAGGTYGATVRLKSLSPTMVTVADKESRLIELRAELTMRVTRALVEGEGALIERVAVALPE